MMRSLPIKEEDAEYADALQRLRNLSPWTMTTGRDSFGAFCVSFAIEEYSGHVALRCWSKRQATSLILLHVKHWEETSSHPVDQKRSDSHANVSDDHSWCTYYPCSSCDWDYETTEYPD